MSETLEASSQIRIFADAAPKTRLAALDGIRGLLALTVVLIHALDYCGDRALGSIAPEVVWGFFILSGCVLSRNWDGKWGIFLVRRVLRLWPTHLACLALAFSLNGTPIHTIDVCLFPWTVSPFSTVYVLHLANPPTWSLCIEVASILFMPMIGLCGRCGLIGLLSGLIVALLLALFVHPACLNLVFFMIGAAFSRVGRVRCRLLESRVPQWLGRISYSLYLAHCPLFMFAVHWLGPKAPLLCLPLILAAAWLIWCAVERPSIALSKLRWLPGLVRKGASIRARLFPAPRSVSAANGYLNTSEPGLA